MNFIQIIFLLGCLQLTKGTSAQTTAPTHIYSYQYVERQSYIAEPSSIKRFEIRDLFSKTDTGWIATDVLASNVKVRLYRHGLTGSTITGIRKIDTIFLQADGPEYFIPNKHVALNKNNSITQMQDFDARILQMSVATGDVIVSQTSKLVQYIPNAEEQKQILAALKPWLNNQYQKFSACKSYFHLAQTTIDTILSSNTIFIDSSNSFLYGVGDRLLTVIFPVSTIYKNYYPFNHNCFREDNGYEGFRITCYWPQNTPVTFLGDELTYLDHADFDNNGTDEFLFWYGIHNHEGYLLFYDDFTNVAEKIWSYH